MPKPKPTDLHSELQSKRYLTEHEVAALTGRAVQTLRNDRHRRRGFPYRKFNKSVRYFLPEIIAIMESHRIDPQEVI
jgi:hypothetical protein